MNKYSSFVDAINLLRKINLQNQAAAIRHGMTDFLSVSAFIREYKIVSLDCGRQVGKTNYILNNAEPSDLIIVPTQSQAVGYERQLLPQKSHEVWVAHSIPNKLISNSCSFRDIYIDEPASLIKNSAIFNLLLQRVYVASQIVMLGSPY